MSRAGSTAAPPWWAALPPAEVQVGCGDVTHRLRWADGALSALDHPDADGELVLAALGGEQAHCIELLQAWAERSGDLDVLAAGPRSAADAMTVTPAELAAGPAHPGGWFGYAPMTGATYGQAAPGGPAHGAAGGSWSRLGRRAAGAGRSAAAVLVQAAAAGAVSGSAGGPAVQSVQRPGGGMMSISSTGGLAARLQRLARIQTASGAARAAFAARWQARRKADRAWADRERLLGLLALGTGLAMRLSGTVAAAWADGGPRAGDRAAHRPALTAALAGRLAPAAADWLGIGPDRVQTTLHEGPGWGQLASTGDGAGRTLRAALPADWLARVWAAGLAVADGHLVVDVQAADWPRATVLAVPAPGAGPVILTVRAAGGGWHRDPAGD